MRPRIIAACVLTWLFLPQVRTVVAQSPQILSLSPDGTVVWTNPVPGNLAIFERSTNVAGGDWEPFFYDWGTNGLLTTHLPPGSGVSTFYRVGVRTNIPDPSLVVHLPFDNNLSEGIVLDVSGQGNNGIRFSATNWPSAALGPDGSQAAQFTRYGSVSGDYVAVPYASNLDGLSNGTILVWAYYTANSYGASALLDTAWWQFDNSWVLGRNYAFNTKFSVTKSGGEVHVVSYPDSTSNYDTGGWHYYGVTWDGHNFIGYFDGIPISTNSQAGIPELIIGGRFRWIGVGCRHHDGTPDWGDDLYPNNGWMAGFMDDVRIYDRALSPAEILALYASFDKLPPSVPAGVVATGASSSQIILRWNRADDLFGVVGYCIRRNGVLVGTNTRPSFIDGGLQPESAYTYTVQAFDFSGNYSSESTAITMTTLASGVVDLVLDDGDGSPWIQPMGSWGAGYVTNAVWSGIYLNTFVHDGRAEKGKSFVFAPPLAEGGHYNIYLRHPGIVGSSHLFSPAVPVDIVSDGTTNTIFINQRTGIGQWKFLGQFPLSPGAYVRLRTDGTSTDHYIVGDAVRFVK